MSDRKLETGSRERSGMVRGSDQAMVCELLYLEFNSELGS